MPEQTVCLERERQSNQSGLLTKLRETGKKSRNLLTALICFSNPIGFSMIYLPVIYLRDAFKKTENNGLNFGDRVASGLLGITIPLAEVFIGYGVLAKYFD
ncbi:MAG TPA: hypothetical protein VMZ91_11880 [Candidatus Paceibacterota bacterium]|nr:hypothetical protein [Candidatus Paceibacterota bacterium]